MNKTNDPKLISTILSKLPKSRDGHYVKMHLFVVCHDEDLGARYYEAYVLKRYRGYLFCIVRNLIYPDIVAYEDVPLENFEYCDVYYTVYDPVKYPTASEVIRALSDIEYKK